MRATKWLADVMKRRVHKIQDISSKCLPSFIFFLGVLNEHSKINHRNRLNKVNNIHSLLVTTVTDQTKENLKPQRVRHMPVNIYEHELMTPTHCYVSDSKAINSLVRLFNQSTYSIQTKVVSNRNISTKTRPRYTNLSI